MSVVYLDHAATTPLDADVLNIMTPYFSEYFGNASSLYRQGQRGREALDDARLSLSKGIGCQLDEIIFTSGATEANNLAIQGVLQSWKKNNPDRVPHIICSAIEHSSVMAVFESLQEENLATVSIVPVTKNGIVAVEDLKKLHTPDTVLVSIMAVNNEVGTIQPLARIGRFCQKNTIIFHVDAVQGAGYIAISMDHWKCNMISLSAHKFYGPKGVGLLAIRAGTEICAQILGGGQERSYRGGTENVPGIVGMAAAFKKSEEMREEEAARLQKLQLFAREYIQENMRDIKWNGSYNHDERVASNINFSIGDISGESLLMRLDLEGVALSLGSACSAGMTSPSHVLLAIGCSDEQANTGVRITMGRSTTHENLSQALKKIAQVVQTLREDQEFF